MDTPQSRRACQKETEALKGRLTELDLQKLVKVLEVHRKDNAQILNEVRYQQDQNSQQLGHLINRRQLDNDAIFAHMRKQEEFNEKLMSTLERVLRNQEQILALEKARTQGVRISLQALKPSLVLPLDDIDMESTTSSPATAMTATSEHGLISGSLSDTNRPTTVVEPFHFSRTADSVRAIVFEFDRLDVAQKLDRRLGYPTQEAYRSEYRYINNRRTVMTEISYIMEQENQTREQAISILQEVLDKSGRKIAAFQKSLRDRQTRRSEKGKVLHDSNGCSNDSDKHRQTDSCK